MNYFMLCFVGFFFYSKITLPKGPCCDTSLMLRHFCTLSLAASATQNALDGSVEGVPGFVTILAENKGWSL